MESIQTAADDRFKYLQNWTESFPRLHFPSFRITITGVLGHLVAILHNFAGLVGFSLSDSRRDFERPSVSAYITQRVNYRISSRVVQFGTLQPF
jgi:hypothetical protein